MGKAARNRAVMAVAVQATVGKPDTITRSVARRMRRAAHQQRRARRYKLLERLAHTARTQPADHRPAVRPQPASKSLWHRARGTMRR